MNIKRLLTALVFGMIFFSFLLYFLQAPLTSLFMPTILLYQSGDLQVRSYRSLKKSTALRSSLSQLVMPDRC